MDQYRTVRFERRNAEDWEEAALDVIASGGVRALAIPALAESLGVTKGSFYWHFDSLDALIDAALHRWELADRLTLGELEQVADPARRLRGAFEEAMKLERAQSLYVTLTSSPDAEVVKVLRRVSQRRIRFLASAYRELGLRAAEAHDRALLTYTAYLGIIHVRRQAIEGLRTAHDMEAYVSHAARTLIPRRVKRSEGIGPRSSSSGSEPTVEKGSK